MHYARWHRHGDPEKVLHARCSPTGEVAHGTPHGYNYHRCRCELCATWRLEYNRVRRERLPEELPLAARKCWLKKKYGLTPEDYDELLSGQAGVCAICGRPPRGRRDKYLHVDHDHQTGAVRGLLCHSCNTGIGQFEENLEWLMAAMAYVERVSV